jgi:hypothetical protein
MSSVKARTTALIGIKGIKGGKKWNFEKICFST